MNQKDTTTSAVLPLDKAPRKDVYFTYNKQGERIDFLSYKNAKDYVKTFKARRIFEQHINKYGYMKTIEHIFINGQKIRSQIK